MQVSVCFDVAERLAETGCADDIEGEELDLLTRIYLNGVVLIREILAQYQLHELLYPKVPVGFEGQVLLARIADMPTSKSINLRAQIELELIAL